MKKSKPCPVCGGEDRFYYASRKQIWICNQCGHIERDSEASDATDSAPVQKSLTPEQTALAWRGYKAVAEWCASYLFGGSADARQALDYLHRRGFADETLQAFDVGFHPDVWRGGVGDFLFRNDHDAYIGAMDGGVLGPQGKPKNLLRGCITLPYYDPDGNCRMLRGRKLNAGTGPKYLSPAGVGLFAGGEPVLFGLHLAKDASSVVLAEGELKAMLAHQSGVPCVAQPGIGYLPYEALRPLAGKSVTICYDSEARNHPFVLSPGERFSIQNAEKLVGKDLVSQQSRLEKKLADAKADDDTSDLTGQLHAIQEEIQRFKAMNIKCRVARLPRRADEPKVDIDSYILAHGVEAFRAVVEKSQDAWNWLERHKPRSYWISDGSTYGHDEKGRPVQLANYQVRIVADVHETDGDNETFSHDIAVLSPSGTIRHGNVPGSDWSDNRKAMQAIRAAAGDGTADDAGGTAFRAFKVLSRHGDDPIKLERYTATGWQRINNRWHYLANDGSVTSRGVDLSVRCEIGAETQGNHYQMCGAGDTQAGAEAFLRFLRGEVCQQHIAMLLAGQAALPLLHRWYGDAGRTTIWLYAPTGSLKSALVRVVMALYGPSFTAVRGDGAPVTKWDATSVGLQEVVHTFRDSLVLLDDYKPGMMRQDQISRFLHSHGESTGRTRSRKGLGIDRVRTSRSIAVATAETLPEFDDSGAMARLITIELPQTSVDADALADLQQAGSDGHLAAFWRGFVQQIARTLDVGEERLRQAIRDRIAQDDADLPGHRRTAGALRQNRVAFLLLTTWLHRAGYIDQGEHDALNAAHIEARITAAGEQQQQQQEAKQHRIFLNILSDALATEMARLQDEAEELLNDADEAQGKRVLWQRGTPIGFRCKHNEVDAIALYPDAALKLVNEWRRSQGVQPLNKQVVNTGLERDKLLLAQDKRQRTYQVRNPLTGEKVRVLLLPGDIFDGDIFGIKETGDCPYCLYPESKQERNRDKNGTHPDEEKQMPVPTVPIVPTKNIHYIGPENPSPHRGVNGNMNVCQKNAGTLGTTGASGVLPHSNGECVVPISGTPKNEKGTIGTGDDDYDSLFFHIETRGGMFACQIEFEDCLDWKRRERRPYKCSVNAMAFLLIRQSRNTRLRFRSDHRRRRRRR
ncbi:MAG: DUF927 domain-containing protein [Chloroflexaceae bacterium]|nr:DUF927 domain-containing protein [Chloroflexaceae bacterium]